MPAHPAGGGRRIVVVDHGSTRAVANQTCEDVAARLSALLGEPVLATHMEIAAPIFATELERIAADPSVREVVVVPLFFARGKHLTVDIQGALDALSAARPDIRVRSLGALAERDDFTAFLAAAIGPLVNG